MSLLILLLNTFDYIMGKQFVIYIGNILFIVKVNLCFFGNVATLLRIVFRWSYVSKTIYQYIDVSEPQVKDLIYFCPTRCFIFAILT